MFARMIEFEVEGAAAGHAEAAQAFERLAAPEMRRLSGYEGGVSAAVGRRARSRRRSVGERGSDAVGGGERGARAGDGAIAPVAGAPYVERGLRGGVRRPPDAVAEGRTHGLRGQGAAHGVGGTGLRPRLWRGVCLRLPLPALPQHITYERSAGSQHKDGFVLLRRRRGFAQQRMADALLVRRVAVQTTKGGERALARAWGGRGADEGVGSRFRGNDAAPGIGGDGLRAPSWMHRQRSLTSIPPSPSSFRLP